MLTKLRERPRGSVLLLVLFLLIVLAMMGSAFSILLPVEMQNAKRDRANIQTAYAADAAVLWVMDQLDDNDDLRQDDGWKDLEGETQVLSKEWEWRIASVDRLSGEEAYKVVTEGIRIRGSQKDVLRRAVAIIDNSWVGEQAAIINLATSGSSSPMGTNANTYWPGNVPIYGDAIVLGNWAVDDSQFDTSNGPIFTGTITQTAGGGNGLRGETYKSNPLDSAGYDDVYTNGTDGVQTGQVSDLEDLYMDADGTRQNMQKYLFSTSDTATIDAMNTTVRNTNGFHIALNGDGVPNGGFVVNDGYGNNDNYEVVLSADSNGNSIMTYTGDSLSTFDSIISTDPSNLNAPPGTAPSGPTGSTFSVIHATDDPSYGSGDHLVIRSGGPTGTVIYNEPADFSGGIVVYNMGSMEVSGTFTGEKTIGASLGVTIKGELLKAGLPRGMRTSEALAADDATVSAADKELIKNSLLGLVSCVQADNQSQGFIFDIPSQPVPGDDNIYIHASLMGSSKTNVNAKMFGHNAGHNLFSSAEVSIYGQIATAQTNAGQYAKEMDFFANNVSAVYSDEVPIGFPTNIEGFTPRLRAYVDQQSFETE